MKNEKQKLQNEIEKLSDIIAMDVSSSTMDLINELIIKIKQYEKL